MSRFEPLRSNADVRAVFGLARPCPECPFRKDRPGFLGRARVQHIIDEQAHGVPFMCHKTTSARGIRTDDRRARYCAGAMRYGEATHRHILPMRLGMALGLWSPDQLRRDVAVLDSPGALLAHHEGLNWHPQMPFTSWRPQGHLIAISELVDQTLREPALIVNIGGVQP
ncbi:hypothetical protein [Deinococcus multiflagellatus]|uniref:Uracil-DNA glycosylase n=1 Tax=Deinococcus multiflagellatus TaxID=1656887 RepID=A0ABW1ZRD9_9DEIO|nr:hypothetical protein [Deinococcus multiflagellatus]MBZ9715337.1 hypothetical protein [Deinococcus multiflagellatus]